MSVSPRATPANRTRTIFFVWLGWALVMLAFQAFALARFDLVRPDRTLDWTASWTNADAMERHFYLKTPILQGHSAWDSEFYVSIALHGYEDPAMRAASPASTPDVEVAGPKKDHPKWVSLNHAFFPGYPFAMGLIARPLAAVGVNPIGAATFAGVLVSLLASLFAMLAIADLARAKDETGADLRAAFYLVVWPAAVFLAQVYSEALFLAFSFGALAMLRRERWGWAAALAAGAVFTRATGVLLIIPFGWAWLFGAGGRSPNRSSTRALAALAPALAYLVWRWLLGADFDFVETKYFGRAPFAIGQSLEAWGDFFDSFMNGSALTRSYEWVELAGAVVWFITSLAYWRRDKALSLYGLATLGVVLTSGAALGMHRYALATPTLFLAPAAWGVSPVFDRVWTLACCLGLAALTLSFSFGFWAG
ncbi:MAG TPA: mannosyltransferase family protein [Caulobacteraceae bacterium]|nr:mannosyltransferase family protein [Caulobacteraceae bacterium]